MSSKKKFNRQWIPFFTLHSMKEAKQILLKLGAAMLWIVSGSVSYKSWYYLTPTGCLFQAAKIRHNESTPKTGGILRWVRVFNSKLPVKLEVSPRFGAWVDRWEISRRCEKPMVNAGCVDQKWGSDDVIEVIGSGFRPVELTLFSDFVKAGWIEWTYQCSDFSDFHIC